MRPRKRWGLTLVKRSINSCILRGSESENYFARNAREKFYSVPRPVFDDLSCHCRHSLPWNQANWKERAFLVLLGLE